MKKYGLFTKFVTKENKRDEFAAILLEVSEDLSSKGLHQFIIYNDMEDLNSVCVSEIWDSKEDHDNSLKEGGNKDVIAKAVQLLSGKPERVELDLLGGKGV